MGSIDPNVLVEQVLERVEEGKDPFLVLLYAGGGKYGIIHHQDCCESVNLLESNMDKVVGKTIKAVHVETDNELPPGIAAGELESFTNTTFTFTAYDGKKGTMRFLGTSNGYYSENVDFEEIEAPAISKKAILLAMALQAKFGFKQRSIDKKKLIQMMAAMISEHYPERK